MSKNLSSTASCTLRVSRRPRGSLRGCHTQLNGFHFGINVARYITISDHKKTVISLCVTNSPSQRNKVNTETGRAVAQSKQTELTCNRPCARWESESPQHPSHPRPTFSRRRHSLLLVRPGFGVASVRFLGIFRRLPIRRLIICGW